MLRLFMKKCTMNSSQIDSIPVLPDDLLLLIFWELTMEERKSLQPSCKRFREVDLNLGKRSFDSMVVRWTKNLHLISACTNKGNEYRIRGGGYQGLFRVPRPPLSLTNHNLRLFRRARAERLTLSFDSNCPVTDVAITSNILKTVTFKRVNIVFEGLPDLEILATFLNGCAMKNTVFSIILVTPFNSSPGDINEARKLLMQLPQIDYLYLQLQYKMSKTKMLRIRKTDFSQGYLGTDIEKACILDDETLLKITTVTKGANVVTGSVCTAQGILNAFELIRQSQIEKKFVQFFAPTAAINELFAMPNLRFYNLPSFSSRRLTDHATRSMMIFGDLWGDNYEVTMGKTDENGDMAWFTRGHKSAR